MNTKVYLAGPITGTSYGETTSWRDQVKLQLDAYGLQGYSPMRGKAFLQGIQKIEDNYPQDLLSSITGINIRDYNDCKTAGVVLVNLLEAKKVSIGTVMEIAWARAFQIPCVIVMERSNQNIHQHAMLEYGNLVVHTLDEGVAATIQLLLP